jgi:hypothetical protein
VFLKECLESLIGDKEMQEKVADRYIKLYWRLICDHERKG